MGQIYLENIRTYSHHGCMQEETIIGSEYRVDLWVDADLFVAAQTDDLNDTTATTTTTNNKQQTTNNNTTTNRY